MSRVSVDSHLLNQLLEACSHSTHEELIEAVKKDAVPHACDELSEVTTALASGDWTVTQPVPGHWVAAREAAPWGDTAGNATWEGPTAYAALAAGKTALGMP